ncbi:tenascin-like [Mytilus californianus]|uniref:tenascin-like n=1 Tax=Mytilus californianus TaxID=6549 RepID=UPI0022451D3D|nr:tenascin-like [Mytilus californianus]
MCKDTTKTSPKEDLKLSIKIGTTDKEDKADTAFPRDCSALDPLSVSGVYRIYPAALVEFDVYCDMDTMCGGWTVFQQRIDGTHNFFTDWNAYKTGFGDLNEEFWLGNDYLHSITSSGQHRLRVELEAYDGSTAYAEYSTFNIDDSKSDYILNISGYSGNAGDSFDYHNGMKFSTSDKDNDIASWNCATSSVGAWWYANCHSSNLNGRYGIVDDHTGVPIVYVHQLLYNATFGSTVTLNCSVSTTTSSTITEVYWQKWDECQIKYISSTTTSSSAKYSGSTVNTPSLTVFNAEGLDVASYTCFASNIAGTGYSTASFLNVSAAAFPRDCNDLGLLSGSGVYRIYPTTSVEFDVYCDKDIMCGRWTVFQKRFDGAYGFFRDWNAYKIGFGDLNQEFWLGNDYLHYITSSGQYRLRVELEAYDGSTAYAEYSTFSIGDSQSDYNLNVGGYSGNAGM